MNKGCIVFVPRKAWAQTPTTFGINWPRRTVPYHLLVIAAAKRRMNSPRATSRTHADASTTSGKIYRTQSTTARRGKRRHGNKTWR